MMRKNLNLFENEVEDNLSRIDEQVSKAALQHKMTPLTKTVVTMSEAAPKEEDSECSSESIANLNNEQYDAILSEADCDAISIDSNLNRAVSAILKNRKSEFDDSSFKKRR